MFFFGGEEYMLRNVTTSVFAKILVSSTWQLVWMKLVETIPRKKNLAAKFTLGKKLPSVNLAAKYELGTKLVETKKKGKIKSYTCGM